LIHWCTNSANDRLFEQFSIMAPPSKLAIATSAVRRLVKEEASYHKEIAQQKVRIQRLEGDKEDENAEYQLKQEVCASPSRIMPANHGPIEASANRD
jgi:hypothetical protein